jgi:hypothetical protein
VLRRSSTGRLGGRAAGDGGATPELPSWTGTAPIEWREKSDRKIDGPREPGRDKVGFSVLSLPFLIFLFWFLELLPNFFTLSDTGTESPRQVEMGLVFLFCPFLF